MKELLRATAAFALAAVTFTCCDNTVVNGDGPPAPEYTSPATVLKAVQISFNQHNIDYLKKSLSPDFVFYFDPRDVGQSPPGREYVIPPSWPCDDFTKAAHNMQQKAYSTNASINTTGVGTPGEKETTYKAEEVKISLLVMYDEANGFIVDKGHCDFAFERYATEKGERLWRLTGWWDRTSKGYDECAAAAPASLGKLLALYYGE